MKMCTITRSNIRHFLLTDQRAAIYKKRQARGHNHVDNKVRSKGGGATYKMAKKVSALIDVMKSAPEALVTSTPSTNS